MMHNGNFDKDGLSDATAKQACIMGARSKALLGQMKIAADSMMGVPDAQIEPLEDYEGDIDNAARPSSPCPTRKPTPAPSPCPSTKPAA